MEVAIFELPFVKLTVSVDHFAIAIHFLTIAFAHIDGPILPSNYLTVLALFRHFNQYILNEIPFLLFSALDRAKQKIMDCFQHLLKQLICYTVSKQILSKMVTSLYPIGFLVLSLCIIRLQCLNPPCQGLVKSLKALTDFGQTKSILNELQNQKCLTKVIPRYKWSQNMSHIQVKVQFSASTPCNEIIFENKSVIHNEFHFRVFCLHGKLLIDYNLTVRTFKSLDFETAVWRQQEQNSFVLECLKSPAPYFWPLLHSRQIVPGRTPKVWWEMLSKYGPQLRKVINLLQIGDVDREISKQVKRKKKPQKSKIIEFSCNQGSPEYLGSWF